MPDGSLLSGITRESIMEIARELGIEVKECRITPSMLYTADEIFLCGTAMEIKTCDKRRWKNYR